MLFKVYDRNNNEENLRHIVDILSEGGVLIFPTDTTYAIGCHALKERAVDQVCKIKRIDPSKHPLAIICYDMRHISEYARISNATFKLMKRNLPGAFTFLLSGTSRLPKIFRNRKEIGVRMPACEWLIELTKLLEAPLVTTSLPLDNLEPEYSIHPDLIEECFGKQVDMVVDGGIGELGFSTIVDCRDDDFRIVRQGKGILKSY